MISEVWKKHEFDIKTYFDDDDYAENYDRIKDRIEKVGLRLHTYIWGYQKYGLVNVIGEKVFKGNWKEINNYLEEVEKGNIIALDSDRCLTSLKK